MTRRAGLLGPVLIGLVLLSLNLRPTAVSVGPVLEEVRAGLGMSAATAGLLTSLPVIAFATFGALAPAVARRIGTHRATLFSVLAAVVGLLGRVLVDDQVAFLALSFVALSGMAVANVLIPSLVRLHYPDRIGRVTAVYSTALAVGLTAAFVLTVPIANAMGSWRAGLGAWAVLAVIAALPWIALARHDTPDPTVVQVAEDAVGFRDVARTPLGLAMAAFFGLQSFQAYAVFGWFASLWRDAGFSATQAGALVGLVAGLGIPLSLWAPRVIARPGDQRHVVLGVLACYPIAFIGLIVAPHSWAIVWAVVLGVAMSTFPMVLALIGLRSRTAQGTAALSGFTQSVGYAIAAIGPFAVGTLRDATGSWTVPLLLLSALTVPLMALGAYVARPKALEDQLGTADRLTGH